MADDGDGLHGGLADCLGVYWPFIVNAQDKIGWLLKDTIGMFGSWPVHCCELNGNESTRGNREEASSSAEHIAIFISGSRIQTPIYGGGGRARGVE